MTDYENYQQTITESNDEVFTDNYQNQYDWNDEWQGCESYMEYCITWA